MQEKTVLNMSTAKTHKQQRKGQNEEDAEDEEAENENENENIKSSRTVASMILIFLFGKRFARLILRVLVFRCHRLTCV